MNKRIIFAILIALAIVAPAASQHFTIVDCDGIQVEYIGIQRGLERLCLLVHQTAGPAEEANMEVSKVVFYDLVDLYITLYLVLDRADLVDISMYQTVLDMIARYTRVTCELADTVDIRLIYDVDLRVDTGDGALLVDLHAGAISCPRGVFDMAVLYDHSWRTWDRLKEYTPE